MRAREIILFFLVACCISNIANSQNTWINNAEMQFKIQVPKNYKQNQFIEGTDKILALVSPDENVAVRVRAMKATNQVTTGLLQQVFEQNIISGAKRIMNEEGDLHGIPATASAYTWNYNNIATVIGAYYIIQNGFAYIVWTIVPQNKLTQSSAEADAIIDSFTLLNSQHNYTEGINNDTGNFPTQNTVSQPLFLVKAFLGTVVDDNLNVSNSTTSFLKNVPQINLGFNYSGNPEGKPFQIKWFSKTHDQYLNETMLDPQFINNGKGFGFISNQGNEWPIGQYVVEIWHNGKNLGQRNFQIR